MALNLWSGDKFGDRKWKQYYDIDSFDPLDQSVYAIQPRDSCKDPLVYYKE